MTFRFSHLRVVFLIGLLACAGNVRADGPPPTRFDDNPPPNRESPHQPPPQPPDDTTSATTPTAAEAIDNGTPLLSSTADPAAQRRHYTMDDLIDGNGPSGSDSGSMDDLL